MRRQGPQKEIIMSAPCNEPSRKPDSRRFPVQRITRMATVAAVTAGLAVQGTAPVISAYAATAPRVQEGEAVAAADARESADQPVVHYAEQIPGSTKTRGEELLKQSEQQLEQHEAAYGRAREQASQARKPYADAELAAARAQAQADARAAEARRQASEELVKKTQEAADAVKQANAEADRAQSALDAANEKKSAADTLLEQASKAAESARLDLERAKEAAAGLTPEDVERAQAALDQVQRKLDAATAAEEAASADVERKKQALQQADDAADAASKAYQDALAQQESAANRLAAARSELAAAQDDLAKAEAGGDSEALKAAQDRVKQAEDALKAAEGEVASNAEKVADAQEKLSAAQEAQTAAKAEAEQADQAHADALAQLQDAKARQKAADDALAAAKDEHADALTKLEAAKQQIEDLTQAKADADQNVVKAQREKDAADASVAAARSAVEEAQKKLAEANVKTADGMFAFFKDVGADKALIVLTEMDYTSKYTFKGFPDDATSISNVRKALDYMDQINEIRLGNGVAPLVVTDMSMALSELISNYYANARLPDGQLLPGGKTYMGITMSAKGDPIERLTTDESSYKMVNNRYVHCLGVSVNSNSKKPIADFTFCEVREGSDWGKEYTVEEYRERFEDWISRAANNTELAEALKAAQESLANAKADAADKQAALEHVEEQARLAAQRLDAASGPVKQAEAQVAAAEKKVASAQDVAAREGTRVAEAASAADNAQARAADAHDRHQQAEAAADAAKQSLQNAQGILQQSKQALAASKDEVEAARQNLREIEQNGGLDAARKRVEAAESAVAEESEFLSQAEGRASQSKLKADAAVSERDERAADHASAEQRLRDESDRVAHAVADRDAAEKTAARLKGLLNAVESAQLAFGQAADRQADATEQRDQAELDANQSRAVYDLAQRALRASQDRKDHLDDIDLEADDASAGIQDLDALLKAYRAQKLDATEKKREHAAASAQLTAFEASDAYRALLDAIEFSRANRDAASADYTAARAAYAKLLETWDAGKESETHAPDDAAEQTRPGDALVPVAAPSDGSSPNESIVRDRLPQTGDSINGLVAVIGTMGITLMSIGTYESLKRQR